MARLVLTRKQNERIILDNSTVIEVLSIQSGRVRLGVIADKRVKVMREEVLLQQQRRAEKGAVK